MLFQAKSTTMTRESARSGTSTGTISLEHGRARFNGSSANEMIKQVSLYDRAAAAVRSIFDSRIQGPPVLDVSRWFPAGQRFAASWKAIRDEAMSLTRRMEDVPRFHDIMPEQASISANDNRDWRLFMLKAYGVSFPENIAACPTLAGLLAATPEVLSASLSFMAPGKHIPPHRGPFRGILRFYLVLEMPKLADGEPAAILHVDGVDYRLNDGEYLLWDDTFIHEVLNRSDRVRAVLLLDVWRPGMPMDMEVFSRLIAFGVRLGMRSRRLARLCEMTNTVAGTPVRNSPLARGAARARSTIMPPSQAR
jgi:aspartate beta-hydroxylase